MPESMTRDDFIRGLTRLQQSIYAYVCTQLVDRSAVDDVFQNTNLALWRKFDAGEDIRDLRAFAYSVARYEVLAYLKTQRRERLRFDDELLGMVADESIAQAERFDADRDLLAHCLGELPAHSRELIEQRYRADGSVKAIADRAGRSAAAVSQSLYRIRNLLAACIEANRGEDA